MDRRFVTAHELDSRWQPGRVIGSSSFDLGGTGWATFADGAAQLRNRAAPSADFKRIPIVSEYSRIRVQVQTRNQNEMELSNHTEKPTGASALRLTNRRRQQPASGAATQSTPRDHTDGANVFQTSCVLKPTVDRRNQIVDIISRHAIVSSSCRRHRANTGRLAPLRFNLRTRGIATLDVN